MRLVELHEVLSYYDFKHQFDGMINLILHEHNALLLLIVQYRPKSPQLGFFQILSSRVASSYSSRSSLNSPNMDYYEEE